MSNTKYTCALCGGYFSKTDLVNTNDKLCNCRSTMSGGYTNPVIPSNGTMSGYYMTLEQYRNSKNKEKTKSHSCFLFHKWGKWEQYQQEVYSTKHQLTHYTLRQRRNCLRCNKMQDEIV